MKRTIIFSISFISLLISTAQNRSIQVQDRNFYTVGNFGIMEELRISRDSLLIIPKKDSSFVTRQEYRVESRTRIGTYEVLFVQRVIPADIKSSKMQLKGIFFLHSGKDGSYLKVMQNLRWFNTLQEAQGSLLHVTALNDAWFDTWYVRPTFELLIKRPPIGTTDKKTMQAIVDEWAASINNGHQEYERSRNDSVIYGPRAWQSPLTEVLIKHHLNPLTSIQAINERAAHLGVRFPEEPDLRLGRHTEMISDSVRRETSKQ